MKIILFLNGERGINIYRKLDDNGLSVINLVTPKLNVKRLIYKIPDIANKLIGVDNVNAESFLFQIRNLKPDLIIVAGFSQILKDNILEIPKLGILNLHAGTLPEYRGGSPLNWQLINGEEKAGVSIIKLDKGIDTGRIVGQAYFKIEESDNINDLHRKANLLFPGLTIKAIEKLLKGEEGEKQIESKAVYWHQRNDDDGFIDFRGKSAIQIQRLIRALISPYPGAWSISNGIKVRIFEAIVPEFKICGTPGRVVFLQGDGPFIICADKAIKILKYKFEDYIPQKLKHGDIMSDKSQIDNL